MTYGSKASYIADLTQSAARSEAAASAALAAGDLAAAGYHRRKVASLRSEATRLSASVAAQDQGIREQLGKGHQPDQSAPQQATDAISLAPQQEASDSSDPNVEAIIARIISSDQPASPKPLADQSRMVGSAISATEDEVEAVVARIMASHQPAPPVPFTDEPGVVGSAVSAADDEAEAIARRIAAA